MFGHLKAEDFVSLIEGEELPAKLRSHLTRCAQCRETWESMQHVRNEVTSMETDIPEPDWVHFRSTVRDELLSRSIQRESRVRRWTGWTIRPTVAWALSLLMAVGITTVTVIWNIDRHTNEPAAPVDRIETPAAEPASELVGAGPERSLFDDVVSLGEEQQEQFRKMLESEQ